MSTASSIYDDVRLELLTRCGVIVSSSGAALKLAFSIWDTYSPNDCAESEALCDLFHTQEPGINKCVQCGSCDCLMCLVLDRSESLEDELIKFVL